MTTVFRLLPCLGLLLVNACQGPPDTPPVPAGTIAPWPVPSNESDLIKAAGQDDLTTGTKQTVTWTIHLSRSRLKSHLHSERTWRRDAI